MALFSARRLLDRADEAADSASLTLSSAAIEKPREAALAEKARHNAYRYRVISSAKQKKFEINKQTLTSIRRGMIPPVETMGSEHSETSATSGVRC